jgi:hypothetical protein
MDLVEAARWLNVAAFTASFISGWIFWRWPCTCAGDAQRHTVQFSPAVVVFQLVLFRTTFLLLILAAGRLMGYLSRKTAAF